MEKLVEKWASVMGLDVKYEPKIAENVTLDVTLIEEEVGELFKAVGEEDLKGIADGICDSIWVIIRLAQRYGLPVEKLFERVYESNMSKLISMNDEDYVKNIEDSIKNLIQTGKAEKVSVSIKDGYAILRNADTGKVLKPLTFKEPNFDDILDGKRFI